MSEEFRNARDDDYMRKRRKQRRKELKQKIHKFMATNGILKEEVPEDQVIIDTLMEENDD